MRSPGRPVRLARTGLITAALIGTTLALPTGTAVAAPQPSSTDVTRSTWLTTDSHTPHDNTTTGDARVGSWRDDQGRRHTGKTYFTFDLARLQGAAVFSALVRLPEVAANDCAMPRATELWLVKPHGPISWAAQPHELVKLAGPQALEGCVDERVTWDLGDAVRQALDEGGTTLTVVARIAADFQGDVAYGRTYGTNPWIYVEYNKPPATPTGLKLSDVDCGTGPLVTAAREPYVSAEVTDPDGSHSLQARIAFWPEAAPDQRREVFPVGASGGHASAYFPSDLLRDGETYAWAVQGDDDFTTSEWSEPCRFTVDHTAPAVAPTVSSPVYKENGGPLGDGGKGVPGEFTFTANGVADVVAFEYDGIGVPHGRIAADRPGGSATLSVTPTSDGPLGISVRGVDQAGNRSPDRTYRFRVRTTATAPSITGGWPQLGRPTEMTFTSGQEGAVEFTYRLDEGPESTVPVGPDGTANVTITVVAPDPDIHELDVWTTTAAGQKSDVGTRVMYVDPMRPEVSVDPWDGVVGQERTVFFVATMPGAVSFTYRLDNGPETTVPASAEGTGRATITPTEAGWSGVYVSSTNGEGIRSGAGSAVFPVGSAAPSVAGAEYPRWLTSGGPGVKGTFTVSSVLPGVSEYRYSISDGPQRSVTAGPDGTASFEHTPTEPGYVSISVRAVSAAGIVSDEGTYTFSVNGLEPEITSPQFPPGTGIGGKVGEPIEFTFTAALTGSTEYTYRVNSGPDTTVPAGTDGKATITYTPTATGVIRVEVFSRRDPEGYVSGTRDGYYSVVS